MPGEKFPQSESNNENYSENTRGESAKLGGKVLTEAEMSDPEILEHDFQMPDGNLFHGTKEEYRQALDDYNENLRDIING